MLKESRVFGGDHGIANVRRHVVVINRDAVLVIELGHLNGLAILDAINGRSLGCVHGLYVVGQVLEHRDAG